jgi:hypothetical protein
MAPVGLAENLKTRCNATTIGTFARRLATRDESLGARSALARTSADSAPVSHEASHRGLPEVDKALALAA